MPTVFKTKSSDLKSAKKQLDLKQTAPRHRFFHAFYLKPSLRFETQSPTEQVILLLRAHPITQIVWIITALTMMMLPIFFNFLLTAFLSPLQIIFINLVWYSFIFGYVFLNVLNWLFNVGIVTDERIIDVDFTGLLYKEVTGSAIKKIEDVTVKTGGFMASIFNFGNLFIQTAGTELNIEFINIPAPTEAAAIIHELMSKN